MSSGDLTPTFDASAQYAGIADLRAAATYRDWPAIRALYGAADWHSRWAFADDVAERADVQHFLREVIERDPDDLVATTLYGSRLITMAWDIRTGLPAGEVSREQSERYHDLLRQAEEILAWVCEGDTGEVVARTLRLLTARGLRLGEEEAIERYRRIIAVEPHYVPAQRLLLQQLCPKSGGHLATMHAFAWRCMEDAPAGAHNGTVVVDAHLENWRIVEKLTYFEDPAVRQEIRQAGERSVLHPDFRQTPGWVSTVSMFAWAYSLIEDWAAAKQCFVRLGHRADRQGWELLRGGAEHAFSQCRAIAMQRG